MHNYLQLTLQWWQQHLAITMQHQYYRNSTLSMAIRTNTRNHLFRHGISAYVLQRSL